MAGRTAILAVRVVADAKRVQGGLKPAETAVAKFDRGLAKANRTAAAVVGGLALVGKAAFDQASALQQSAGAVDAVFGKQAKAVHKNAKAAADAFGLARSDYSQTAAVFGSQLKTMGFAADQLAPKTDQLIGLGADLAATFGGSTSKAVEAIGSLMRGERDPIEAYGVSIKQADINARMAADGTDKLTGAAKKQAEAEATLALLYEQTASAQGQRSREATTAAARQETAMAKLKNTGAALGAILLPVVATLAGHLATAAGFVERNSQAFTILAGVVGGFALAIMGVNLAWKAYQAATAAAAVVQKVFNAAMRANPIGLIITAVLLLIGGFVLLYKRSATFRAIIQAVGAAGKAALGAITSAVKTAVTWIGSKLGSAANTAKRIGTAAFKAYTTPIRTVYNLIRDLVNKLKSVKWPKPPAWMSKAGGAIKGLFGGGGPTTSWRPAPGAARAAGLGGPGDTYLAALGSSRSGAGMVVINVTGALDPVSVAKQITELLRRQGIRTGTVRT